MQLTKDPIITINDSDLENVSKAMDLIDKTNGVGEDEDDSK